MDVLAVINQINRTGLGYLKGSADSAQFLYDVSGDNYVDSFDILRIINWMNRDGVAEGEPTAKIDKNELAHGLGSERAMLGRSATASLPSVAPMSMSNQIVETVEGLDDPQVLLFDRHETQSNSNTEHHDAVFANWSPSEWDDVSPISRSRRNTKW